MVYYDDEGSGSLKTITMIIAAVTLIAFGGMYFVYSSSQQNTTEPKTIVPIAPPGQGQPLPNVKPVHTHV